MKISQGELSSALKTIGRNSDARRILLEALLAIERTLTFPNFDVRELVTGPICDAMHEPSEEITRRLADGTMVSALYASKITRDFVMAGEPPDHVWEPQTTRTLLAFAAQAKIVLIGGAYIGDHAVLMAKAMRGRGIVHCFEPSEDSIRMLRKNTAQNNLDNLVINAAGLWSGDVSLALSGDDSHAASHLAAPGEPGSFPATSINEYGRRQGIGRIDVIVLDIEGGELAALKGATDFLSQDPGRAPKLVFEVHRSYVDWTFGLDKTEIVTFLTGLGYHAFALRDYNSNVSMEGRGIEIVSPESVWLEGPPHGFNVIAVKDPSVLEHGGFALRWGVSPKLLQHRDPVYHGPLD